MIIYSKRKNSLKPFFPYVNVALVLLLIGAFIAFNMPSNNEAPLPVVEEPLAQVVETVDVSGEWIGTMTEDYGAEIRYDYRIVLSQSGTSIRGTDFQESTNFDSGIYGEASLIGSMNGTSLYFYEANVMQLDGVTLDSWCRIEVRLDYQVVNGLETLIGTWDSAEEVRAGCTTVTGRVVLTRQAE
jgi:hypothetical protein